MKLLAVAILGALTLPGCFGLLDGGDSGVGPEDYIRDTTYKSWHVEVDYANGLRPADSLLAFVDSQMTALVRKPEGIKLETNDALPGDSSTSWGDNQLVDYATAHRNHNTGNGQVVTHLLFVAGHHASDSSDSKVLAATYDYDLIVVFPETIQASCTLTNLCTDVKPMMQAAVLHEFGHALGLVNRGTPMVHAHEANSCFGREDHNHSVSTSSVMYCAVESSDITSLLRNGGRIPQDFDPNDKEDLHAAGGL